MTPYYRSRTYRVWENMKARCLNPKHPSYPTYGGIGISVCSRWSSDYRAFEADMGSAPKGMSLDRVNPKGNYEPGNCRWATWEMQGNNRRSHFKVEYLGREMTLAQAVRLAGGVVRINAAWSRIKRRGWSVATAVETPKQRPGRASSLREKAA